MHFNTTLTKALARGLVAGFCLLASAVTSAADGITVSTDFAGGSGVVESIDQRLRLVNLSPPDQKERGWRVWWYVRVDRLTPGELFRVNVGNTPWATPERAAVSDDNQTWKQTTSGERDGKRIMYSHVATAKTMWVAWGPPLLPKQAESLVKSAAEKSPGAEAFELCRSREGRAVWALRFAPAERLAEGKPHFGIWVQARQHAWEAGSSWVADGLIDWLVSDDERARRLRSVATIVIVPIVDVDNVEVGAGGKDEIPHDHNRDWTDKPRHPAVAAAQAEIKRMAAAGQFDLFVDLHNPGAGARNSFFYLSPRKMLTERGTRNLDHFLAAARADLTGGLMFKGDVQESGDNYDKQWQAIAKNWVTFHTGGHVVAATLEIPWNTPDSTATGYRCMGKNLGLALERYLRANPR